MTTQIQNKPGNEPETGEKKVSYYYPLAISGLAQASGAPLEPVALAACSLLAGLAGPSAGLYDESRNRLITPALNVMMMGLEVPTWNAAQNLLLDRMESLAKQLRDFAGTVNLKAIEEKAGAPRPSPGEQVCELLKQRFFENSIDELPPDPDRSLCLIRRPTCIIRGADPGTFSTGADEILDDDVLLLYPDGDLLPRLLGPRPGKPWSDFGGDLAGALSGESRISSRRGSGGGRLQSIMATIFANCSHGQIKQALMSNRPTVTKLLESCWVVDVDAEPVECGTPDFASISYGCRIYTEAVGRVFSLRRSGHGLTYIVNSLLRAQLHEGMHELHHLFAGKLSPGMMPFFRNWRTLPLRILWGLITLQTPKDDPGDCVPLALYLTRWVMERQLALLEGIEEETKRESQQRARAAVIRKLAGGPRTMRELVRGFSVQRQDVHGPVVDELIDEGLIERTGDGLLMVKPNARFSAN